MRNHKLIASVASACTMGLLVGVGAVALVGSASAATPNAKYDVALTGSQEVFPPGGDPQGIGSGQVKVKGKSSTICVKFKKISGIGAAIAAHIHQGPAGSDGPVVFTAATPVQTGKKYQKSKFCAVNVALAAQLTSNPSNFYLNVHTAEFSGGAIRGQLG